MCKLLEGPSWLLCVAGFILLFTVAGFAESEGQRDTHKTLRTPPVSAAMEPRARKFESQPTVTRTPLSSVDIGLTEEEEAWLARHPEIVLGTTTEYPPIVISNADGTHVGMMIDLFDQLNRRLYGKLRLHIEDPWYRVQEKARDKDLDGLALAGRNSQREALFNATNTLVSTYFSVFARSEDEFQLHRFLDLQGMRIGYKKGAGATRSLLEKLPSAVLRSFDSHETLTQALLSREIDVIVAWMSYDFWRKERLQGTIDNVLLLHEYPIEMAVHLRKDWPLLVSIFNKAIASVRQEELPRIINKWFGDPPQTAAPADEFLTAEERAWLSAHRSIPLCVNPDWMPYEKITEAGKYEGMIADYMALISERLRVAFAPLHTKSLNESMEALSAGRCLMLSSWAPRIDSKDPGVSTEPYLTLTDVLAVPQDAPFISEHDSLTGLRIGAVAEYPVAVKLKRRYPNAERILVDSVDDGVRMVADGELDAFAASQSAIGYAIRKQNLINVKLGGVMPGVGRVRMLVNRDAPVLASILDKAAATISPQDRQRIASKWFAVAFERETDYALVFKIVVGFLLLLFGVLGWLYVIQRQKRVLAERETRLIESEKRLRFANMELTSAKEAADAANRAKTIFLANMSHELRTPLNAILGFSRRLARDRGASQDHRDKFSLINRSGEHLLSMINDLLDLSKIEAGRENVRLEIFDLHSMLEEIARLFEIRASEAGLRFVLESTAELPKYIEADRGKLYNILQNLVGNAVKHTQRGGICLRAQNSPLTGDLTKSWLCLEVEDTGEGIEPEDQVRIFEAFYRVGHLETDVKGSGLGLAIIKSYVEMMDGRIRVESMPGKGSLFRVELPVGLTEASAVMDERVLDQEITGLASSEPAWRVLVAEDNADNRLLLCSLLRDMGFSVREAENGEEAIEQFEQWRPHLIWMDMRMPVLDGYAATRRIRDLSGGDTIKIIAITASAFEEQRQDILEVGCDEVVYKPFHDEEILDAMVRVLGVAYRYEYLDTRLRQMSENVLSAGVLAGLPLALRKDLEDAALLLDMESISNVIRRIRATAPETARHLWVLAQSFRFDRIRALLEEARDGDTAPKTRLQSEVADGE